MGHVSVRKSPQLESWLNGGRWFEWNSHRVFFRDEGEGPVILLLHGYPTGSYDWHRIWPMLVQGHRLIAPDFLGLGFSDKPSGHGYSISSHAQTIEALMDSLGIAEVHVVAHDLGVRVAQEMLALREFPGTNSLIRSLVLLNGAMCPEAYRPRPIQRLLASPVGHWVAPHIPRSAFDKVIRSLFGSQTRADPDLLDDFWALVEHGEGRRVMHLVGRFWTPRWAMRERLVGALLRSRVPLRVINGAADANSGQHMIRRLLELAPHTDVTSFEEVGHWPHIEVPDSTAPAIVEFIRSSIHLPVIGPNSPG